MNRNLPRTDRNLLAGQAAGAGALAIAWAISPATGSGRSAIVILAVALALAAWAFRSLGASFRAAPTPHPQASFVRTGIYRWLRHPMYIAAALVATAAGVSRPSLAVLTITALNLAFYLVKARYEERVLLDHYREYEGYRGETIGVSPLERSAASGDKRRSRGRKGE